MLKVFNIPFSTMIGSNSELIPYYCGQEKCKPGYSWGPGIRDHYLIHYIIEGKGSFKVRDQEYALEKGQGFLIYPNDIAFYQADLENPWRYKWVAFHGIKSDSILSWAGLYPDCPVFTYNKDDCLANCIKEMIRTKKNKSFKYKEVKMTSLLYDFMSVLIEANNDGKVRKKDNIKDSYLKEAVDYIHINYSRRLTISEIAKHIGIDRKYLHYIFKESTSLSPQEFLIQYKIKRACDLISNDSLAIGDIARSVGYEDSLQFSRIFKKINGISPSKYRKNNKYIEIT